jgi:hypothetical protein
MRFPSVYIESLFLSFILTLVIFYFFYKTNLSNFIGDLNNELYIYSALICIIGFLITFYYIMIKDNFTQEDVDKIFITILIIIKCTSSWIICSYYKIKILDIIFLSILCISNYYLLIAIINIHEEKYKILKYMSILSISYLLFHHIAIDLFLWNYYN